MCFSGFSFRFVLCGVYINIYVLDEVGGVWREWGREFLVFMLLFRFLEERIMGDGMGDGGFFRE